MISLILTALLAFGGKQIDQPNVLVIVVDDIGASDLNSARVITPNIDYIANNGLVFNRAYGMPTCSPARSSLMFSKYFDMERGSICYPPTNNTPDINWLSLAKVFEAQGYTSAAIGKWHLGTNTIGSPGYKTPYLHGFNVIKRLMPSNVSQDCDLLLGNNYDNWVATNGIDMFIETNYNTTVIRNQLMLFWANTTGPKFAYVAFQAAHGPFHDPPHSLVPRPPTWPAGNTSFTRWQFEKMIQSLDTAIGAFASLNLENTYVIIVGDNGTPEQAVAPNQNPNKVKTTTFEGGTRIPFIIYGPGIQPGSSNSLVHLVDVLPTLAQIVGFDLTSYQLDGQSLVPLFTDPTVQVHDHIFTSLDDDNAVVEVGGYKLRNVAGVETFYNIITDPQENVIIDPATIDPAIVIFLRDKMNDYLNRGL